MSQTSQSLFDTAQQYIPGGVNSPVRAFKAVGGTPRFIVQAQGAHLTDVEGKKYLDYIGSWGPMILGHAHPQVIASIVETAKRGTSFGTPNPLEVEMAEWLCKKMPSLEMVRLVNSGTEATMAALRLARGATKRDLVVKFEGCYHGHGDSFLISAGSGAATFGVPSSPGVTPGTAKDTLSARYNDLDSVRALFRQYRQQIAAVIIEPVAGNMGVVLPEKGFLQGLRDICTSAGSLLIFDEVMTGFRVAFGGAQELFQIKPDLTTLGKIIGGGLPVGAYGGRKDLMSQIAPSGPIYQAGTLSGNPLAVAAGLATLKLLDAKVYETLERLSARLTQAMEASAKKHKIPIQIHRQGSMLTVYFCSHPIHHFQEAQKADHTRFAKLFNFFLDRGIHLPPSGYEAWFLSTAHTEKDLDQTAHCFEDFLKTLQS
ncbi:MAG: glutamate-1-semialdehyde 2,1-aminomutase [Planctomycetota bacterium]